MIIRIFATESGAAWSTRILVYRSDRVDVVSGDTYYPVAYDVKLNVEMGKIGKLSFVVPPDHPYYDHFVKKKTILTVTQDASNAGEDGTSCLFRGQIKDIGCDIFKQKTITAESALSYLEHSLHVPTGKSKVRASRKANLKKAISDHNSQMSDEPEKKFTLGTIDDFQGMMARAAVTVPDDTGGGSQGSGDGGDDGGSGSGSSSGSSSGSNQNPTGEEYNDTSYTQTMDFINSHAINDCHGYLRVRYNKNFSKQYLDFIEGYGNTASQKIRFAVNLEDLSFEDTSSDIYSVLVPIGKNALTLDGTRTSKSDTFVPDDDESGSEEDNPLDDGSSDEDENNPRAEVTVPTDTGGGGTTSSGGDETGGDDSGSGSGSGSSSGGNSSGSGGVSGTRTVKYRDMAGAWKSLTVQISGKYLKIPAAIDAYGYIYKPVSYSDKSTAESLLQAALDEISSTYHGESFTANVKALDMHYLDDDVKSIRLGDVVTVVKNDSGDKIKAICSAIAYDFSAPENTEYTIGTANETLTGGSGGGGSGSSGGGGSGGYGGAIDDCIGYIIDNRKIIDGEILEINTAITNINSDIVTIGGNMTALQQQIADQGNTVTLINSDYLMFHDNIIATVNSLQTQYHDLETGVTSQIVQTANSITSTISGMETQMSQIEQTLDSITLSVTGLNGQMSQIVQTADSITSTVSAMNGRLSTIEQTADSITSTVHGMENQMSQIVQTADSITSTVNAMDGRMSQIEQTVDSITSTVTGIEGQFSQIVQTADSITSTVNALDGRMSQIEQTVDSITSTVTGIEGQYSQIVQTIDSITSTVQGIDGQMSQIVQTADSITSTVTGLEGRMTSIEQTADHIRLTVENQDGRMSQIEQTVDGITSTVSGIEGQFSQIQQTADFITATVNGMDGRVSQIEQKVDSITMTVTGMDDRFAAIEMTADSITSMVNAMDGRISTIEQTADSITLSVNGLDGQMSQIQQTVNSITSTVTSLDGQVSQIAQTADMIQAQVFDDHGNSIIEQMVNHVNIFVNHFEDANGNFTTTGLQINQNNLSFGVYTTGTNGSQQLTAGVLVNKLSDGTTTTKIKADYIDFEGVVNADFINNRFLSGQALHIVTGSTDGNWTVNGNLFANEIVVNGSHETVSLVNGGITTAIVGIGDYDGSHPITYDGTTVTIPYKTVDGVAHSFSFNRPVSGSIDGSWSGNQFNVYVNGGSTPTWTETVGLQFTNPAANAYYVSIYYVDHEYHNNMILNSTSQQITLGNYGPTTSSVTTIQIQNSSGSKISTETPELLLALVVSNSDPYVYLRKRNADNSWTTIATADNTYAEQQADPTIEGVWNNSTGYYRVYLNGTEAINTAVGMQWIKSGDTYVAQAFHASDDSTEAISVGRTEYKLGTYGVTTNSYTTVQIQQASNSNKVPNTAELRLDLTVGEDTAYIKNGSTIVARKSHTYYSNGMSDERNNISTRFGYDQGGYYISAYDTTQDPNHNPVDIKRQYYQLAIDGSTSSSKVVVQDSSGNHTSSMPEISVGTLYTTGLAASGLTFSTTNKTISKTSGAGSVKQYTLSASHSLFDANSHLANILVTLTNTTGGTTGAPSTMTFTDAIDASGVYTSGYNTGWNGGGDTAHVYYKAATDIGDVTPATLAYDTIYNFYCRYINASGADTNATGANLSSTYKPYVSRYIATPKNLALSAWVGAAVVQDGVIPEGAESITGVYGRVYRYKVYYKNASGTNMTPTDSTYGPNERYITIPKDHYLAISGSNIVRSTETSVTSYAITAQINSVLYSSSTHKYTARAGAYANGTIMAAADPVVSGVEAYIEGRNVGGNGSWVNIYSASDGIPNDATTDQVVTVAPGRTYYAQARYTHYKNLNGTESESVNAEANAIARRYFTVPKDHYLAISGSNIVRSTETSVTSYAITAQINSVLYSSSTHKYTARAGAYANGTLMAAADPVVSGVEAYIDGRNVGGNAAWANVIRISTTGEIPNDAAESQIIPVAYGSSYIVQTRYTHYKNLNGTESESADATGQTISVRYFTVPKDHYLAISGSNIVRSTETSVTSYAITAQINSVLYSSSTHKYTARAGAYANGTLMAAADPVVSGVEAYNDGINYGGDSAHVYYSAITDAGDVTPTELAYKTTYKFYCKYIDSSGADTDATGANLASGYKPYVIRYFKTKPDHYLAISGSNIVRSTETSVTSYAITAQINSVLYSSSTHKYTARAGAYANGTLMAAADPVVSGVEAYNDGWQAAYDANNMPPSAYSSVDNSELKTYVTMYWPKQASNMNVDGGVSSRNYHPDLVNVTYVKDGNDLKLTTKIAIRQGATVGSGNFVAARTKEYTLAGAASGGSTPTPSYSVSVVESGSAPESAIQSVLQGWSPTHYTGSVPSAANYTYRYIKFKVDGKQRSIYFA